MTRTEQTPASGMPEQAKRGRGRPRVEQPLSPAERAKRYRERKRWQRASQQTETAGRPHALAHQLQTANARIADLAGALHEVVLVASAGKRIPPHLLKGLVKLLAD